MNASKALWILFGGFVIAALCWKPPAAPSQFQGVALLIWSTLVAFTAYSAYCSSKEALSLNEIAMRFLK